MTDGLVHALLGAVLVGAGATAVMDVWTFLRQPLLGVPRPDYALVGRWLMYMPRGRFRHDAITATPPLAGEREVGWVLHYLTGIVFAAVLLLWQGMAWLQQPTPGPALTVGVVSVAAPFLLMQPGMGAGIAASRSAKPAQARFNSLLTHAVFGAGLYIAAVLFTGLGIL